MLEFAPSNIDHEELDKTVMSFALEEGWNWPLIQGLVPDYIYSRITSVKPPSPGKEGALTWSLSGDGTFSIKDAYNLLARVPDNAQVTNYSFKKV